MSRAIAILSALLLLPGLSYAQSPQSLRNAHWVFSRNMLSFNSGSGLPTADTLPTTGHACISDTAGHLLGYLARNLSNQWGVFDSSGAELPGFPSDLTLSSGGYPPAAFIPKPGNPDSTHLLFIGRPTGTADSNAGLLTMRLSSAGVQPAGIHPAIHWFSSNVGVCQFAVPAADGEGYWLVVQPVGTAAFHAHRLDADGISPLPVISSAGPVRGPAVKYGHMVANLAGDRFVASYRHGSHASDTMRIELFSFDAGSGTVSHTATLPSRRPEGIAFSPSGRFLYVLEHYIIPPLSGVRLTLVQYDMEAGDIASTRTAVHEYELPTPGYIGVRNQLALGIDGRIYRCHESPTDTLGVIMEPDSPAEACGYDHQGLVCLSKARSLPAPLKRYIDTPGIATRTPAAAENTPAACWPRPLAEQGTLSHPALRGRVLLEWRDASGRFVRSETVIADDGRVRLDASDLPAGSYMLRVHSVRLHAPLAARVLVAR